MLEEADSEPEIGFLNEINAAAPPAATPADDSRKRKADQGGGAAAAASAGGGSSEKQAKGEEGEGQGEGDDEEMEEGGGEVEEQQQQQAAGPGAAAAEPREPGCLLRVEWGEAPQEMSGFRLRDVLGNREAGIRFVEYDIGGTVAVVRFENAAAATAALDAFAVRCVMVGWVGDDGGVG